MGDHAGHDAARSLGRLGEEVFSRIDLPAHGLPLREERLLQAAHRRAFDQAQLVVPVLLVELPDVHAAGEAHGPVHDHDLAVVQVAGEERRLPHQHLRAALAQEVDELDDLGVVGVRAEIVDQQAHPNPFADFLGHELGERPAHGVGLVLIDLDVHGLLGLRDGLRQRSQHLAVDQEPDGVLARALRAGHRV
jgi:hypothetical protein